LLSARRLGPLALSAHGAYIENQHERFRLLRGTAPATKLFTLAGWSFHVNDILIFMGRRSGAKSPDAKPLEIAATFCVCEKGPAALHLGHCAQVLIGMAGFFLSLAALKCIPAAFLQTSPLC